MRLEIREAATAADFLAGLKIRRDVFVTEQRVPMDLEIDDTDFAAGTVHIIGVLEGRAVAVGRLTPLEGVPDYGDFEVPVLTREGSPAGVSGAAQRARAARHVGRLAVVSEHRGLGCGADLVAGCVSLAAQRWPHPEPLLLELSAQTYAIGFYERCGFALVPDRAVYLDAGIEHRDMVALLDPAAGS